MYQPKGPSVCSVFHRQSIGFLYSRPTCFPFGSSFVGWLYTRVNAYRNGVSHWDRESTWMTHCISGLHRCELVVSQRFRRTARGHSRVRTTHIPDTELLARNVHMLSAGRMPFETSWFLVQLYEGNWTWRARST